MTASATEFLVYESDREFQLWSWHVSHSQMILRSNPSSDAPLRTEICFKNVRAASVTSSFPSLRVSAIIEGSEVSAAEAVIGRGLNLVPYTDEVLFRLSGGSLHGWVLASVVAGREDAESYSSPSMFDGKNSRPNVSEIFPQFPHPRRE